MIVIDSNVLISTIIGVRASDQFERILRGGAEVAVPTAQAAEVRQVLVTKFNFSPDYADALVNKITDRVRLLEPASYQTAEGQARARLHDRAQPDWPVLAAAIVFDAAIWSNDRDFFGVGVPVWSTRNIVLAAPGAL